MAEIEVWWTPVVKEFGQLKENGSRLVRGGRQRYRPTPAGPVQSSNIIIHPNITTECFRQFMPKSTKT